MSGAVIVEKKVVIKAEDQVTEPLARINQKLDQFMQKFNSLGSAWGSSTSHQQEFKQALERTKAGMDEADTSAEKLHNQIDRLKGKTVTVKGDTSEANRKLKQTEEETKRLGNQHPTIKPEVNTIGLRTGQREASRFSNLLESMRGTMRRVDNSSFMQKTNHSLERTNELANITKTSFGHLRETIAGTAIGMAVGNGITAAFGMAKNAILGAASAGIQYNMQMEKMNATWTTLTGSAHKAQAMTDSIVDLSNKLGQSVEVTDELSQQFYHVLDNQPKTEQLTKSFLTMGDAIGLSGDRLEQVGMDFTHMMSASKLQLGELNQITDAFPMFGEALLKYERKVQNNSNLSMNELRKQISAGKIASQDAIDVMNKLGDKYKEASDNLMGTLPGLFRMIQSKWKQLMGEAMAPTTNAANPVVKQVSKWVADKNTTKEFERLGEAVNNGVGSIMKALANNFGDGSVSKMLDNMVNGLTRFVKAVSSWTSRNAGSIVTTIKSLATIGKDLAEGAFDTVSGFLRAVTGTKSSGMKGIADSLSAIAKHETAIKVVGGIIGTYFLASKLGTAASYFNSIYRSLLLISTIGLKKSATGTLLGDLVNFREGQKATSLTKLGDFVKHERITPVVDKEAVTRVERYGSEAGQGFVSRFLAKIRGANFGFSTLFKGASSSAEIEGAEAGGSFIARFGSKALSGGKLLMVGRGIAGKLVGGISAVLSVVDIARALTPSFKGDRWNMLGKGAGSLIGTGIGAVFGGPVGAAIGGTIGNTIGGWLGKGAHKGWDLLKKVMDGKVSFSGMKKGFMNTLSNMKKWAGDTWKSIKKWWNGEDDDKSSSNSKTPSQHEIKSLGGNHYSKTDIANVKAMNSAIKAYTNSLRALKSAVKKNDPTKELNSMNKALTSNQKGLTKYAKEAQKLAKSFSAFKTASKNLNSMNKELKNFGGKNDGFAKLTKDLQNLDKVTKKSKFGSEISKQMKEASESVNGKHSFISAFSRMIKSLNSDLRSFKRTFTRDWSKVWDDLDDDANSGLKSVASHVDSRFDSILSREHKFTATFLKSWRSWIDDVKSSFRNGFDKLPGYASSSMRDIVSRLNRGISGINSVISQFGGDKRLSTISYANGTFAHPGGKAILNDGLTAHKQELVWQPSRGWSLPRTQNAVYDLEEGSMVLDAEHTHPILQSAGIPHYAGGTLSDDEMEKMGEEFENNPVKASRELMLKLTNWASPIRLVSSLGKAMAIKFSQSIANVLKDLLGEIKEPINGDWTPVIKSAAAHMGVHLAGWQIGKLLRQIQTESGGKEKQTQLGASDDPDGDGSGRALGLLQFKRSTFEADAVPGHHNIWSGYDQIMAAINALNMGREGGWGNIGNGHGWASGGHLTQLDHAWLADNPEHDEFVINPYASNAVPLLQEAWDKVAINRPELRSATTSQFNQTMLGLVASAVKKLDNIDIHPVVQMDEFRRINDKQNSVVYRTIKG